MLPLKKQKEFYMTQNHSFSTEIIDGKERINVQCKNENKKVFEADLNVFAPTQVNTVKETTCPYCNQKLSATTNKGKITHVMDSYR
jgi:hypothetical protein